MPYKPTGLNWKGQIHFALIQAANQALRPFRESAMSLERPTFIWGSGQSGTFLLYDLLSLSGSLAFPAIRQPRKKGLAPSLRKKPVEGIFVGWAGTGLVYETHHRWHIHGRLTPDDVAKIDLEEVRARYESLAMRWRWQHSPKRRILDKFPNYLFMIEAIDALFSDARHIFVVRDPRMILSSMLHRFKVPRYESSWKGPSSGFYGNILLPGHERYVGQSLEVRHAWQIEQVMRTGFEMAKNLGERCIISHHEDVLASPQSALDRITDFLEIDRIVAPRSGIRPARIFPSNAVPFVDNDKVPKSFTDFAVRCGYAGAKAGKHTHSIGLEIQTLRRKLR